METLLQEFKDNVNKSATNRIGKDWGLIYTYVHVIHSLSLSLSLSLSVLSPPQSLHMTHYSSSCILIQWDPPAAPGKGESSLTLLGYKIYINGESERMVRETETERQGSRWSLCMTPIYSNTFGYGELIKIYSNVYTLTSTFLTIQYIYIHYIHY